MSAFSQPSTALRRDRLSDQIAQDIETRILSGEISVGDALPSERSLMEHYNVGRPAVREALLWLNKKGLVGISNGDRTRVTEPDPSTLLELLSGAAKMMVAQPRGVKLFQQTRCFVEVAIAREAAANATEEDIAQLERLQKANEATGTDLEAFAATDDAFHYQLAAILRNPLTDALYHSVLELLAEQRRMSLSHPEALEKARAAHRAIFEAVRDHDRDRAEAAMRDHLETVEQTYWEIRGRSDEEET